MTKNEIQIGMEVWTYVGNSKVRVKITSIAVQPHYGDRKRPDRYNVSRVDNGRILTARNAAALHKIENN